MLSHQEHLGSDADIVVGDFVSSQVMDLDIMALKIKALD